MEQSVQTPPADEPPPSPCPSPSPSPEELTPAAALPTPTVLPSRLQAAHPFDTFAFVSRLGANDVSPTTSRTLMEAVRSMIIHRTEIAQTRMLSREEMDNDAYRFKAALSDIRTGHSMRSRRDGVALRIEIETNNRKDETRSDMKRFDIAREEINNKFTISLGDLRTEIEGAKWDATRRAIAIIVTLVVIGVVVSTMGSKPAPVPVPAQAKATMLDVAVGTDNEDHIREAEEELDRLLSKVDQKRRREAAQRRHDAVGRI
ncbi:hypothetical protein CspHIS471_0209830 [Cutaneotrichosporon sp. HIS471]|nr:hypothetical protein CspHIS471_0209830 [Cutaneotrichosporon sp. HIS471]